MSFLPIIRLVEGDCESGLARKPWRTVWRVLQGRLCSDTRQVWPRCGDCSTSACWTPLACVRQHRQRSAALIRYPPNIDSPFAASWIINYRLPAAPINFLSIVRSAESAGNGSSQKIVLRCHQIRSIFRRSAPAGNSRCARQGCCTTTGKCNRVGPAKSSILPDHPFRPAGGFVWRNAQ